MIYFKIVVGLLAWAVSVTLALLIYIAKKLIKKILLYFDVQPEDINEITSPQSTMTTLSPQPLQSPEPQEAHLSTVSTVFPPKEPLEPLKDTHPSTTATIL